MSGNKEDGATKNGKYNTDSTLVSHDTACSTRNRAALYVWEREGSVINGRLPRI